MSGPVCCTSVTSSRVPGGTRLRSACLSRARESASACWASSTTTVTGVGCASAAASASAIATRSPRRTADSAFASGLRGWCRCSAAERCSSRALTSRNASISGCSSSPGTQSTGRTAIPDAVIRRAVARTNALRPMPRSPRTNTRRGAAGSRRPPSSSADSRSRPISCPSVRSRRTGVPPRTQSVSERTATVSTTTFDDIPVPGGSPHGPPRRTACFLHL